MQSLAIDFQRYLEATQRQGLMVLDSRNKPKNTNVVGLEVLNASQRVENPRGVDYAVTE